MAENNNAQQQWKNLAETQNNDLTNLEQKVLGRRELLKALTAAAGAGVMLSLPNKWNTPIIEAGVLPTHAQSSVVTTTTTTLPNTAN